MSEQDLIEASPCKLRNGDWGCKTTEPVEVGDTVRIVTRANKQWRAEITQIVWTGDQVWICETASEDSTKNGASQGKTARPTAPKKTSGKTTEASPTTEEHVPAPPRTEAIPADDLDAMADAAAGRDEEFDDLMSAVAEFERDERE